MKESNKMPAQKVPTVLERLQATEANVQRLQESVDGLFVNLRNSLQAQMEVMEAIIEVAKVSDPEVESKMQKVIETKRLEREVAKAEQEKKQVEQLVEAGILKQAELVSPDSVVVGRIFNKNGEVTGAGRVQSEYGRYTEACQKAILGQGVGFVYETEQAEKFEILEIYDVVQDRTGAGGSPSPVTGQAPTPPALAVVPPAPTETAAEPQV